MRVAFAQLVGPHDRRVVQQRAVSAGFGSFSQPLGQMGDLLAVPRVDLDEFLVGFFIAVGFVRQGGKMSRLSIAVPSIILFKIL